MTLLELKQEVDRLLETQSAGVETTIEDLIVRETGGWRYVDAVVTSRDIGSAADNIDAMQRRIVQAQD